MKTSQYFPCNNIPNVSRLFWGLAEEKAELQVSTCLCVSRNKKRDVSGTKHCVLWEQHCLCRRACKAHFTPTKRCPTTGRQGCTQAAGLGKDTTEERTEHPECTFILARDLRFTDQPWGFFSFSWLLIYNPLGQATLKPDADKRKIMSLGARSQSRQYTLNGAVMLLGQVRDWGAILRFVKTLCYRKQEN